MITVCKKICVPRPPRTRPLGNVCLDHDELSLAQSGRLPRPECLNLSAAEGDVNQFRDGLPANKAVIAEATAAQRAQQMPTRDDDPAPGLAERLVTHRALGRGRRDVPQRQGLHRRDVHVDHHRGSFRRRHFRKTIGWYRVDRKIRCIFCFQLAPIFLLCFVSLPLRENKIARKQKCCAPSRHITFESHNRDFFPSPLSTKRSQNRGVPTTRFQSKIS